MTDEDDTTTATTTTTTGVPDGGEDVALAPAIVEQVWGAQREYEDAIAARAHAIVAERLRGDYAQAETLRADVARILGEAIAGTIGLRVTIHNGSVVPTGRYRSLALAFRYSPLTRAHYVDWTTGTGGADKGASGVERFKTCDEFVCGMAAALLNEAPAPPAPLAPAYVGSWGGGTASPPSLSSPVSWPKGKPNFALCRNCGNTGFDMFGHVCRCGGSLGRSHGDVR